MILYRLGIFAGIFFDMRPPVRPYARDSAASRKIADTLLNLRWSEFGNHLFELCANLRGDPF